MFSCWRLWQRSLLGIRLFSNFDDDRAAAGFKVLGQFAGKTQVLFLTHHQHLLDIAEGTLGASISILSLAEPRLTAAA